MPQLPDLVRLSRLPRVPSSDPQITEHVFTVRHGQEVEYWVRERRLGKGSFGAVYLERCQRNKSTGHIRAAKEGSLRAVKVLARPKDVDYYSELEALAYFSFPQYEQHFVKSFGWFEDTHNIHIAMEYLPLGDMQQYLTESEALPESEAQTLVVQLIEGLSFMHDSGFAHRDLKPANMLVKAVGPAWWIKIADFGISKRATENLTALRTMAGTPAFVAPEVLGVGPFVNSDDTYTNAVDLWSVGVITLLILAAKIYFKDPRHLARYAHGHIEFPAEDLVTNSVSDDGCRFIQALMSINPEDRPTAADSLSHAWLGREQDEAGNPSEPAYPIIQMTSFRPIRQPARSEHTTNTNAEHWDKASAAWSSCDVVESGIESAVRSLDLTDNREKSSSPPKARTRTPNSHRPHVETTSGQSTAVQPRPPWERGRTELVCSTGLVNSVVCAPDGTKVVSGAQARGIPMNSLRLWDVWTGRMVKGFLVREVPRVEINSVAFSPDGQTIATGAHDGKIKLWSVSSGLEKSSWKSPAYMISAVSFSPHGTTIAWASYTGAIRLWDPVTEKQTGVFKSLGNIAATYSANGKTLVRPGNAATRVAYSPDGNMIVSGSEADNRVLIWDIRTGKNVIQFEGHVDGVNSVAFAPDGRTVASGSNDRSARLWDMSTGKEWRALRPCSNAVLSVAFSPNGKKVVSGVWDRKIILWGVDSVKRGQEKMCPNVVKSVAFSPDGRTVAAGGGNPDQTQQPGFVMLWNPGKGASLEIIDDMQER